MTSPFFQFHYSPIVSFPFHIHPHFPEPYYYKRNREDKNKKFSEKQTFESISIAVQLTDESCEKLKIQWKSWVVCL